MRPELLRRTSAKKLTCSPATTSAVRAHITTPIVKRRVAKSLSALLPNQNLTGSILTTCDLSDELVSQIEPHDQCPEERVKPSVPVDRPRPSKGNEKFVGAHTHQQ
ncbi:hypothetical protein EVAR_3554_1 [Eumeta japonica]|uniref:Uncharacterized protein n=1 Tax=Eumeta variegata TaxID=151549 RepID=A0A4C1SVJ3_EUMVA|nr:hypothetical protein EVAR_3554_1 [Eumeta japonica]